MAHSLEDGSAPAPDFYSSRSEELRAATTAGLATYSRYTQALVALGLVACFLVYQAVANKSVPLWSAGFVFLADEIMGGTNSHDRRIATEWVLRALVQRGAIGAISTHDLALTEIAANGLPGRNAYFEDSGESGTLAFDYKLREGILTRSNALNIARILGIDTAAANPIKP